MFPSPSTWIYEAGLPSEARILRFWDNTVPVIRGTCTDVVCSFLPQCGPEEPVSVHKHLLFRRRAIWAKAWVEVEVEDKALRLGFKGPKGVSTS